VFVARRDGGRGWALWRAKRPDMALRPSVSLINHPTTAGYGLTERGKGANCSDKGVMSGCL